MLLFSGKLLAQNFLINLLKISIQEQVQVLETSITGLNRHEDMALDHVKEGFVHHFDRVVGHLIIVAILSSQQLYDALDLRRADGFTNLDLVVNESDILGIDVIQKSIEDLVYFELVCLDTSLDLRRVFVHQLVDIHLLIFG